MWFDAFFVCFISKVYECKIFRVCISWNRDYCIYIIFFFCWSWTFFELKFFFFRIFSSLHTKSDVVGNVGGWLHRLLNYPLTHIYTVVYIHVSALAPAIQSLVHIHIYTYIYALMIDSVCVYQAASWINSSPTLLHSVADEDWWWGAADRVLVHKLQVDMSSSLLWFIIVVHLYLYTICHLQTPINQVVGNMYVYNLMCMCLLVGQLVVSGS